ncbi:META domain-containing protein [Tranquillimonas rosea]|uniref:META domain-containing protein n=1 Tax=Tranquillimonas rosea TaxID=641238 RepID=UPI003BAAA6C9
MPRRDASAAPGPATASPPRRSCRTRGSRSARSPRPAATRRACPALEAERRYFAALREMTLAEVAEGTLILSTPEGRKMVFQAD